MFAETQLFSNLWSLTFSVLFMFAVKRSFFNVQSCKYYRQKQRKLLWLWAWICCAVCRSSRDIALMDWKSKRARRSNITAFTVTLQDSWASPTVPSYKHKTFSLFLFSTTSPHAGIWVYEGVKTSVVHQNQFTQNRKMYSQNQNQHTDHPCCCQ